MRYGIPLPQPDETRFAGGRPERDLEGALQAAAEFFTDQLRKSSFAREYLEKRRIPPELIERFGLGYAPDGWRNLLRRPPSRASPRRTSKPPGWSPGPSSGASLYDRFRHRLMFPIHNASGRLVGFGGRTLGDDKAKYVNTNETDRFHKGHLLYGLHLAKREIRETGRAVLCEGYFDVIGTVACGLDGAVAGMGTALTPEQAKLLSRYAEEVVVAYDGDNAGENAFRRALPLLLAEGLGVRRARFPGGHDPDSLRLEAGEEAVAARRSSAAEDAVDGRDRAADPARRPAAIRGSRPRPPRRSPSCCGPSPTPILRYGYARRRRRPAGDPGRDAGPPRRGRPPGAGPERPRRGTARPSARARPRAGPERRGAGALRAASSRRTRPDPASGGPAAAGGLLRHGMQEYLPGLLRSLCKRGGPPPGRPRGDLPRWGTKAGIVDRFAKILLEGNFASGTDRAPGVPRQAGGPLATATAARSWRDEIRGGRAPEGSSAPRHVSWKRRGPFEPQPASGVPAGAIGSGELSPGHPRRS